MYEAILTLCLAAAGQEVCRDTLLPGYEAETEDACTAQLAARPPAADRAPLVARGAPRCAPAGPALAVTEIAPGVFVHVGAIAEPDAANGGDVANLGFVIGEAGVAAIDAGSTRAVAEGLWRAIRARTDLPVSHLVLTHMHPDHVLGAPLFTEAGAQVAGHAGLDRALADRGATYLESLARLVGPQAALGSGVVAVDLPVEGMGEIDLGGRVLALRAWPPAHTGTDLTATDPQTGTVFAGDLVFDRHAPALDGSLRGWQAVLETMRAEPHDRVVPGHGAATLDWPDGAAPLVRYLDRLAADTRAALDAGERLSEAVDHVAADEAPHWQLFEAYNPRNATVAFTELEWE
ncbi:quinoprotein relay system zinc metallohydrolase 2 [Roseivivax isoporae]|uniref:Beta-lactamase n=1 Tax=Roseivivax isoporae LMG 25204 TaxID=1449351 RepID=X7F982_9RHOB|nr:quinoprotein relay system zinc metallohydrolase 2 [Roseivivax isoporae]ETX28656.1 beta-lactamase [Roseivivax isoporae LMG 25204]